MDLHCVLFLCIAGFSVFGNNAQNQTKPDFLEWLFGLKELVSINVTTPRPVTIILPSRNATPSKVDILTAVTNHSQHSRMTRSLTRVRDQGLHKRNDKQLFPGAYYQYPFLPWTIHPALMSSLNPLQAQRRPRPRPTYNLYLETEEEPSSVEMENSSDAAKEETMEVKLNRLTSEQSAELDGILVEVNSKSSNSRESDESFEHYDTSLDDHDTSVSSENDDYFSRMKLQRRWKRQMSTSSERHFTQVGKHFDTRRQLLSRSRIGALPLADISFNFTTQTPQVMNLRRTVETPATPATVTKPTSASTNVTAATSVPLLGISPSNSVTPSFSETNSTSIALTSTDNTNDIDNVSITSIASSLTPSPPPETTTATTSSNVFDNSTCIPPSATENCTDSVLNESKPTRPTISAVLNCQCGTQTVAAGRVGSTLVRIMTNPWLVEIMSRNKHLCAGSLINDRYILTAASCIDMYEKKSLRVIAGLQSRHPHAFGVAKVLLHPKYDPSTFDNNIALLRLSEFKKPSGHFRPICLPLQEIRHQRQTAHLVTWVQAKHVHGHDHEGRFSGRRLLQLVQTEVELLNNTECQAMTTKAVEGVMISNGTICTKPPAQQNCGGDIGGILQSYAAKFSYEQIGLVSMTVGCRANDLPGIFTDIKHYLGWILFQTQDAQYCREPNGGTFSEYH